MRSSRQYRFSEAKSREWKYSTLSLSQNSHTSQPFILFTYILFILCSTTSNYGPFAAATLQPPIYSELSHDYVVLKLSDASALRINETLVVDFHPSYEVFGGRELPEDSDSSLSSSSRNRPVETGAEQANVTFSNSEPSNDETSPENPSYHRGLAYISPRPFAVSSARILYGAADVVCYMLESPDFKTVETLPIRPGQPLELGDWPFKGIGMVTCLMPR